MSIELPFEFASVDFGGVFSSPIAILALILSMLIIITIGLIYIVRIYFRRHGKMKGAFEKKVLLISLPKFESQDSRGGAQNSIASIQEKIAVAETVFSAIGGLKPQKGLGVWFFGRADHLSFELVADQGKILFYMAVPEYLKNFLEEQIQAQYPDSHIEEAQDYNIFTPKSAVFGKILKFKRQNFFPIKTYKKMESDPLNAMANALSKVDKKDGAVIQFTLRSAKPGWRDSGAAVASRMMQGKKFEEALKGKSVLKQMLMPEKKPSEPGQAPPATYQLSPMEQEIVKNLEEKVSKAAMEVNIRILAASDQSQKSEMYLNDILSSFSQFNIYQYGNSFDVSSRKLSRLIDDYIYRNFDEKAAIILNTEEMASLYHFPIPSVTETPNIAWLEARKAPAPLNIPDEGAILGDNFYRGIRRTVRIKRKDRRRHTYIIGQTGTGKSYFQQNLAIQDIQNGEGVGIIDPHGDSIEEILKYIPKERADDVVLFDPSDTDRPMGLNMLEFETSEQKTFVINEIINIFDKLYDLRQTGGPIFEQYMRNSILLMMEDTDSGSTLMEIPKVLSDENFRAYKLSKTKNVTVKDFWEKEAQKAGGEASLQNMVPYITSKLTQFISNDIMRPIIAQQKSSFNFREVMDNKKILLINLSKGKIGDLNSNLLGMIIVGKLLMASLSRVDTPEDQRHDFYLYIDEFQNFLTESISIILSEARKYKLNLIIAHQFIGQLVKNNDTSIKDAIFGNVGTTVSFRIGIEDAELLAKQFAPVFSEYDVVNIPSKTAYIKLLIDNANPPAFNINVPGRENPKHPEIAETIRKLSRLKYGRDRDIVENEILERTRIEY
ncbi:MAG TPA: type IV secretion system DNA-binding domain-containing protein [Candidatus Bipolaricaulota bacterium]|nr:type IV secretion system DNA-binding domain-containing protein [Candidatus Bipolaricaulota bacterium]